MSLVEALPGFLLLAARPSQDCCFLMALAQVPCQKGSPCRLCAQAPWGWEGQSG